MASARSAKRQGRRRWRMLIGLACLGWSVGVRGELYELRVLEKECREGCEAGFYSALLWRGAADAALHLPRREAGGEGAGKHQLLPPRCQPQRSQGTFKASHLRQDQCTGRADWRPAVRAGQAPAVCRHRCHPRTGAGLFGCTVRLQMREPARSAGLLLAVHAVGQVLQVVRMARRLAGGRTPGCSQQQRCRPSPPAKYLCLCPPCRGSHSVTGSAT